MAAQLIILGATGSLGTHVLRQALAAGYDVSVLVRDPETLPPELRPGISIHTGDLKDPVPPDIIQGHDALINCAGNVADGQEFVALVDGVVTSIESLPPDERPVSWFMAGAALLDIDASGRRGVDLPDVSATYWPHRVNFERLERSTLDWRLLCPGPMVRQPPLGVDRLRISIDRVPVEMPAAAGTLPDSSIVAEFVSLIPQMMVPFDDAAALMLANLDRGNAMTRHRVGLALPAAT